MTQNLTEEHFVVESRPAGFYVVSRVLNRRYGPYNTAEIARIARASILANGLEWADEMESR